MKIHSLSNILLLKEKPQIPRASEPVEAPAKVEQKANKDLADALSDKANDANAQSFKFLNEFRNIWILGQHVAPEDRLSVRGVTAEYLKNMSDEEYKDALMTESQRYCREEIELNTRLFEIIDPERRGSWFVKTGSPSFSPAEAKDTLGDYMSHLSGAITARNQMTNFVSSENGQAYLKNEYGEEGGKKAVAEFKSWIDECDKNIKNLLTSLGIIYKFSSPDIATISNGLWQIHNVDGSYSGPSGSYAFSIQTDGTVKDS